MHLLLFFCSQFITVFQTKVKSTNRGFEFTEQANSILASPESFANSEYQGEYDSDTENNQVNIVAEVSAQAKIGYGNAEN